MGLAVGPIVGATAVIAGAQLMLRRGRPSGGGPILVGLLLIRVGAIVPLSAFWYGRATLIGTGTMTPPRR